MSFLLMLILPLSMFSSLPTSKTLSKGLATKRKLPSQFVFSSTLGVSLVGWEGAQNRKSREVVLKMASKMWLHSMNSRD